MPAFCSICCCPSCRFHRMAVLQWGIPSPAIRLTTSKICHASRSPKVTGCSLRTLGSEKHLFKEGRQIYTAATSLSDHLCKASNDGERRVKGAGERTVKALGLWNQVCIPSAGWQIELEGASEYDVVILHISLWSSFREPKLRIKTTTPFPRYLIKSFSITFPI